MNYQKAMVLYFGFYHKLRKKSRPIF